jgi:CubicO group peptidase (beta-lactamase class C family)
MKIKSTFFIITILLLLLETKSQSLQSIADSIHKSYHIPELAYAVVNSKQVLDIHTLGVRKINTNRQARLDDRFRIGSNTKAITGLIAALLVKENKLSWNTKFFDLFPELKAQSNRAHRQLTLQQLLSFRTRLFPYTYTNHKPYKFQFRGDETEQRYRFCKWFFAQKPMSNNDSIHFSNLGYVAAGLMLEKASGKSYKELVRDLGKKLQIDFRFGNPSDVDSMQTWGHDRHLKPDANQDAFKLEWLLAAGNINLTISDYAKFVREQLLGLSGKSQLLSKEEYTFLHYGLYSFAIGWFWEIDDKQRVFSYNIGNPGSFLSKVFVYKDADLAIILLSNVQSDEAEEGLDVLHDEIKSRYLK